MTNNPNVECVVFDLDGTITMSHESIYKATVQALKKFNLPTDFPENVFYERIGLHFQDIFDEFGINVTDLEEFISVYKSIYFDYIGATKLYPGVEEVLTALNRKNIKTALLTTKAQDQADKILNYFKIADHFDFIMGRRPGIAHKPSPEPLLFICDQLKVDPQKCIMVGDSEMDVRCAKNAGAISCGVTFGYRSREHMEKENPDYIIDSFIQVKDIINHN